MQYLMRKAARASRSGLALLIEGEDSTGKKTLAHAIHNNGPRKNKAFIEVDCSQARDTIDDVLFGPTQAPAKSQSANKISAANGGTLFLEHVDALPADSQRKLLHLIETGEVEQKRRTYKYDVRVITASGANLQELVQKGIFLEELLYRLNIMILSVPPLRERKDDLPVLIGDFLQRFSEQFHKPVTGITPQAVDVLRRHTWPGNLEELKTVLQEAVRFTENDEITPEDFALAAFGEGAFVRETRDSRSAVLSSLDLFDHLGELRPLEDLEAEIIRFALEHYDSRISEVSRRLGIGRSTLYRKMKEHGLEESSPGAFRNP
ncbi:MAG: sigma 54-interacting transcriptional regulator [Methylobacteriaceae bacterium]|jgi:DNA-binding NtrC family response regulator|nr:sigma 54-interacting transcriptional regulator [Methylobacteriaceae bacterium]